MKPQKLAAMDYGTYQKLRAYCWQDLAAYIDTPERNSMLELSMELAGGKIGEIKYEQECAMGLYQCRDLTPRENSAAHLLTVISNHRAIAWQREPHPPAGREPAPPLEQWQAEELARQTRDAVEQYAVYLPEREAAALLAACTSAMEAVHERSKPMPRSTAQDAAILEEIRRQGYDPLALPKNPTGKRGVKAAIGDELCNNHKAIFQSRGVFDTAWQRLRDRQEIL